MKFQYIKDKVSAYFTKGNERSVAVDGVQESFSWGWNVSAELIFLRFLGNRFS